MAKQLQGHNRMPTKDEKANNYSLVVDGRSARKSRDYKINIFTESIVTESRLRNRDKSRQRSNSYSQPPSQPQSQQQSSSSSSSPLIGPGSTGVTRFDGMVVAIFSSLIAPFAGFLASVIKRAYGRKDFGTLLPGHGGVVDRLDCQLILAPFVYFYLSLFKFATATTTTS
mmetsp:Transcript_33914/g.38991  ORF Transcript_33914/g.38991 Transcript_33914/m.38991 type:complete len:170 (-) Transcript_33914:275-784(-)